MIEELEPDDELADESYRERREAIELERAARAAKRERDLALEGRARVAGKLISSQSLIEDGERLVLRGRELVWVHRKRLLWDDIDITDLSDEQFNVFWEKVYLPRTQPDTRS